jgi:hypothetical protein
MLKKSDPRWDRESNLVKYIRATLRIISADSTRSTTPIFFWRNDGSPKLAWCGKKQIYLPSDNRGQADFEIAIRGMPRIHIEAKATKGKQSLYQIEHQRKIELVGERYFIVRNSEEFTSVLRQCGLDHWALENRHARNYDNGSAGRDKTDREKD